MTEFIQSIQTWPQAFTAVGICLIIGVGVVFYLVTILKGIQK
jgi:hypothetical protein